MLLRSNQQADNMQILEAQQGVGVSPMQEWHHQDGWRMQSYHVSTTFWSQDSPDLADSPLRSPGPPCPLR